MERNETELCSHQPDCTLADFFHGFPCGVMYCTYERYPKVIYANQWIFDLLGVSREGEYWNEFLKDNVYFMLPSEEWPSFRKCLRKAEETGEAVGVEHRVKNENDQETQVMGWVRVVTNPQGEKQYLFLYICLPRERQEQHALRERAYLNLLDSAYDGVFKIDRQNRIIECISIKDKMNTRTYFMRGMRVVLDCLLQKSYYMLVYEDDRACVEEFFHRVVTDTGFSSREAAQIEFHTIGDGILKEFDMTAMDLDGETALVCCREVTEEKSARRRKEELKQVSSLKARMDGQGKKAPVEVEVYRVLHGRIMPQSEDSPYLTDGGIPLKEFLAKENIPEDKYQTAMTQGEVELEPLGTPEKRHLYIAHRSVDKNEAEERLLLLYRFAQQQLPSMKSKPRVSIHTFGFFDVRVDGKPIVFPHEKSKEMLALMVDHKGSFVGNPYFISCLWEDEPYSQKIQSRCRQTAFRMMETLKKYGIEDIIEKVDGHRRIIPEKVSCDYFDYINNKEGSKQLFNGMYMSDYSWGEETLSTLLRGADTAPKQN